MRSPNEEQIGKSEKLATDETRLTKNSGISDGTNDEDLLRILLANAKGLGPLISALRLGEIGPY